MKRDKASLIYINQESNFEKEKIKRKKLWIQDENFSPPLQQHTHTQTI